MNQLAKTLREYREKRGVSQGELARALGYANAQYVSNWERNMCFVPKNKLGEIVKILKIPRGHLLEAVYSDAKKELFEQLKGA